VNYDLLLIVWVVILKQEVERKFGSTSTQCDETTIVPLLLTTSIKRVSVSWEDELHWPKWSVCDDPICMGS